MTGSDRWRSTAFTGRTGSRLPIVVAPMAGGPTTPELVAAASEAGAFGILAAGYTTPDALRRAIRAVRAATAAPFGVNVLVPQPVAVDDAEVAAALQLLQPYADELGVSLTHPGPPSDDVEALLEVVVTERVGFLSFTFGLLPVPWVRALREAGIQTCGTATSVREAAALADAGVDMVCLQGAEAGGHRGGFLGDASESAVGLIALVPAVRQVVDLPLIAAGGIMDGYGVAAALTLGADAVQLGTAFLLCPEAGTTAPYRDAVRSADATQTVVTRAFSGKPARGIRNRMVEELAGRALPAYPIMNALTRPLRQAAATADRPEFMSLWAGQGVAGARELPAAALVATLAAETDDALSGADPN